MTTAEAGSFGGRPLCLPVGPFARLSNQALFLELLGHAGLAARQEAGRHPVGDLAQPQVEAGRLELVGRDRTEGGRGDRADLDQALSG